MRPDASGPANPDVAARTRVLLRLRLGPAQHRLLARTTGESFDALTIAGTAAGLRERLDPSRSGPER